MGLSKSTGIQEGEDAVSPEMENLSLEELPWGVNNRSLFTDYYLVELLEENTDDR